MWRVVQTQHLWILWSWSLWTKRVRKQSVSERIKISNNVFSGQVTDPNSWCYKSVSPLPRPLDTAAAAWVDTWQFLAGQLGNASFTSVIVYTVISSQQQMLMNAFKAVIWSQIS